jgi:AcrR family transcriptional regulator
MSPQAVNTGMQARGEETRSRILQSAMALFGRQGYDATGVAGICQAASVSKGAFYHHFASKQAVFLNLLEEWLRLVEVDLAGLLAQAPNVVEGLLDMASRTRGIFRDADGRLSIFLEFWAQARKDPEVWKRAIEPFRRYRKMFAAVLRRGMAEGTIREVNPTAAAQALVSLAVGLIMQGVFDPQGAKWELVTREAILLLIEGIGKR